MIKLIGSPSYEKGGSSDIQISSAAAIKLVINLALRPDSDLTMGPDFVSFKLLCGLVILVGWGGSVGKQCGWLTKVVFQPFAHWIEGEQGEKRRTHRGDP